MSLPFALGTLIGRKSARATSSRRPLMRSVLGAEMLEDRRLLAITVTFHTSLGNFDVELYDEQTPKTVANFLNYVRDNDYDNTIIHRSAWTQTAPFVVQGGGFETDFSSIPTDPPVQNEPGISNTRGTIAMAKVGGDPNSATSQWFFKMGDNSANLDFQNGGFTVFGRVLGNGMQILDAIAALPRFPFGGAFNDLPLRNYTNDDFPSTPTTENLVVITDIAIQGATVGGTIYSDANNNGFRDSGEGGLSNWTVFLDKNNNGVHNAGEPSTITGANGSYQFSGVLPGSYTVRAATRVNHAQTSPASGSGYPITVAAQETISGQDFGFVLVSTPTGLDLAEGSDTGLSSTDNLTRLNNSAAASALTFQVNNLVPNSLVKLFAGNKLIAEVTAAGTSATVTTNGSQVLTEGNHIITAVQFIGGVSSSNSPALVIKVDTQAPTITTTAPDQAAVGLAYSYDAASSDDDAAGVVYSLASAPEGMTINASTGLVVWTPAAGQEGAQSFTVRVTDPAGNSSDQTVNLTVRPPNQPPTATNKSYTLDEDETLEVPASTGLLVGATDPENDPLTAVLVSGPAHGTLQLNPDGSFTYVPNQHFNGTDSFTFRASDGLEQSATATVTLTVNPVADAPVPAADSYTTNEDATLDRAASGGVLANDSNPDGLPITAELVSGVSRGTLSFNSDGSFTYVPTANFHGSDSFTYRILNGGQPSDPVTVTIQVASVNDLPEAGNDSYSIEEDGTLTVPASTGVLANDSDPVEQSPLSAVLVVGPQHGTLTLQPDGSFVYKPAANFFGVDHFTYRANDGSGQSEIATATITVIATPDAPVGAADTYTTSEDVELVVGAPNGVLKNDVDPDGDAVTAVIVSQPSQGQLFFDPDGAFRYVPAPNFAGNVQFQYKLSDGVFESEPITVTIQVTPVNDLPVAADDEYSVEEDGLLFVPPPGLLANDQDIDSSNLSAVLVNGPSHGQLMLGPDGSFSYRPDPNYFGPDQFTYRVSDGAGQSAVATVSIDVEPVDDPPVLNQIGDMSVFTGVALQFQAMASDPDLQDALFFYSLGQGAPAGAAIDPITGEFSWTPGPDVSGEFDLLIRATGDAGEIGQIVRVNVINSAAAAFPGNSLLRFAINTALEQAPLGPSPQPVRPVVAPPQPRLIDPEVLQPDRPSLLDRIQSGDFVVNQAGGEEDEEEGENEQQGDGGGQRNQRRRANRPTGEPQANTSSTGEPVTGGRFVPASQPITSPSDASDRPEVEAAGEDEPVDRRAAELPADFFDLFGSDRSDELSEVFQATLDGSQAEEQAAEVEVDQAGASSADRGGDPAEATAAGLAALSAFATLSLECKQAPAGPAEPIRDDHRPRRRKEIRPTRLGRWCQID